MSLLPREPLRSFDDVLRFERELPFEARVPMRSIHELFSAQAGRFGDRKALTMVMTGDDDEAARALTYSQLLAATTRAANLFTELGGPGAGVACLVPNLLETQIALWGAETSGYAVALNFLLQADHLA